MTATGSIPIRRAAALGVQCHVGTVDTAADAVISRALSGLGGYAVLCNVHVLMTSRHSPTLYEAIGGAWTVFPDGAPVAWLQRRAGADEARRIAGPDLMPAVLDRGRASGVRNVLYGSTPAVVKALRTRLEARFPGVIIAEAYAPPFGTESRQETLDRVRAAEPHVVWLALGAPKQELWMLRHAVDLAPALVLGVGAAFDFHAGARARAPAWMQLAGLEWLHRLRSEPGRLGARYLTTNVDFLVRAALELRRAHHKPEPDLETAGDR